jgi:RNA polymerase sigma-70 factor (ECF subfamily)
VSPVDYHTFTDDELIARMVELEDMDAFTDLVRRYKDRLLTFATRYLGDRSRAEDIVQETFLRVYRARHRYDVNAGARFSTWIYTICSNLIRSEGRKSFWRRRVDVTPHQETETRNLAGRLEASELRDAIEEAIDQLKPHERLVFVLRDVEGLSYDEIAQVAGCPLGTVKSRVNRARHAFKEAYVRLHGVPEFT